MDDDGGVFVVVGTTVVLTAGGGCEPLVVVGASVVLTAGVDAVDDEVGALVELAHPAFSGQSHTLTNYKVSC